LQTQSYFQLIGPLIFLAFSCGFAIIWRYARDSVPLRLFALAFFLGACATFADYMRGAMPPIAAFYATNVFYIATALVFVSALYHYYTQRIPWIFAAVMAVAVPAVLSWYILVDDDIVARIIVMNVCGAFIIAMPAVSLRAHMLRPIDRILQTALVVIGICVGARAGFVIVTGGSGLTAENYAGSMISLALHFTLALSALAIAIVLFIMVGMEIVSRLTETSETDPLTGVLNRRGFEARIADAGRGASQIVVMADIDRFKAINDRYGHEVGDAVIRSFAQILAGTARDNDLVVRWGGEEFLVLLADAEIATARLFAEAVRRVFEEQTHDEDLGGVRATASFGIAPWLDGMSISGASHLADQALYEAKREGRNRVCVHTPGSGSGEGGIAAA